MTGPKPQTQAPALRVSTLNGETWDLEEQSPEHFTMVVFYRGYHCPICKGYLRDLDSKLEQFEQLGVHVVAISSDTHERATKSYEKWGLQHVQLGYGLSIDSAREWGLYVSKAVKEGEPEIFSEPGLYLIRPNGEIYAGAIQTMPFTRPNLDDLYGGLQFIIKNDYPGRGEA